MIGVFPEIRPEERRETSIAFLTLFGILAGHVLLETARDALFLARIPASHLAWVYLSIALLSLVIFALQQRRGETEPNRSSLLVWLASSALITFGFWLLLERTGLWVLYALYIWSGVFTTVIVVRFWTFLGNRFTIVQAKRVFSFIGVGSILGAVVGAALAGLLTSWLPTRHVLLASSTVLMATALGPVLLMSQSASRRETRKPSPGAGKSDQIQLIRRAWAEPYLSRMTGIVLISAVALTLVDFLFKSAVSEHVDPAGLGSFFAQTYFILNLLSLLVQLFLVNWLIRTLDIDRILFLLPVLLTGGALGLALGGGLSAALILKAFDGSLKNSLHRTMIEILYVPLTAELRLRAKGLIDVLGQRGGQAIAALLILVGTTIGYSNLVLSLVVVVLALVWIGNAIRLKTPYLNLFRQSLSEVSIATRFEFPDLDLATLETLMASLNSTNDAEVVAAMDLLAEQGRERLIPALILYHPSNRVVIRALDLFSLAGRQDFIPITERLLVSKNAEVRAANLRALAWVSPSSELYRRFVDDASPVVRTTALVGLVSYAADSQAEESILSLAESGSRDEQLALARVIRYSPGAIYETPLLLLGKSRDLQVREAVAGAMAEIRSPKFLSVLLEMLPDHKLRYQARRALISIGDECLKELEKSLSDPYLNSKIRRQIPRVISEFSPDKAAHALIHYLQKETDGSVRYRVLRALIRLRDQHPGLPLDRKILEQAVEDTLRSVLQSLNWKLIIKEATRADPSRETPAQKMIFDLLEHKESLTIERLFYLISLLYPREDVRTIYRGICSPQKKVRASSMELLHSLLKPPLRDTVLALVDDIPIVQKLSHASRYHQRVEVSYESVLKQLLDRPGIGIRCLVAAHIGELRLHSLTGTLESLPSDLGGLVSRAVDRTLALLSESAAEVAHGE